MRLAYGIVGVAMVGITVGLGACGSSSNDTGPSTTNDAGGDGTSPGSDSSTSETGSADGPLGDDGGACVIDADLTTVSPPDAALNDAGASVGTCISCARTTCNVGVANCNDDCACNNALVCLFNCLSTVGGALTFCAAECIQSGDGGSGLSGLDLAETTLLSCAVKQCGSECAVSGLGGGGGGHDAGHDAGDDGGTDAAGDDGGTDAAGDDGGTDATGE
jgi:hypothetical protein